MRRATFTIVLLGALGALVLVLPACALLKNGAGPADEASLAAYRDLAALEIESPNADTGPFDDIRATPPPFTLDNPRPPEFWDLTLEEAIRRALVQSNVLRDLGGLVIDPPDRVTTTLDPALADTDPRFGVEAALSEFDASFAARLYFEKNDRALNNLFEGGGTRLFMQDLGTYSFGLTKRTATGATLNVRNVMEYNFNNAPANFDPNLPWVAKLEGDFRQPLLRGAGVDFNRIAGPQAIPGFYNGVLLARINSDISLADFEAGVIDLVSAVENAYWELYYAYRDLDAKIEARQRALDTWRKIHVLYQTEQRGGEAEKEAQAREQFYRLDAEVQNALAGTPPEKSVTGNIRGANGVIALERQLRLLMGEPASDGRLIRPSDDPPLVKVVFDWCEILNESLDRRVELRRQKWQVRRRELELVAARNFLLPQLDAVGGYRFRGLGHDLIGYDKNGFRFDNAYGDLTSGDFQEWQLGMEFLAPIGFRRAHAAVRNAELAVARARSILLEQEREIASDLSGAYAETFRAYRLAMINFNRQLSAQQQLQALEAVYEDADASEQTRLLDLLLDAQRRLADAESQYYRSLVEYAVAVKNVHLQKGSLLDLNQVYLSEGPWPGKAYRDAARRMRLRIGPTNLDNYVLTDPPLVSRGTYPQHVLPPGPPVEIIAAPEGELLALPPTRLPAP